MSPKTRNYTSYTVRKQEHGWLWLETDGEVGWGREVDWVSEDEAGDYFARLLREDPKNEWARSTWGGFWCRLKEYDSAIKDFSEAIGLNPSEPMHHFNRGQNWFAKKEYARAAADYTEAIRQKHDLLSAYWNRAEARASLGEFEQAFDDYERYLRLAKSAKGVSSYDYDTEENRANIQRANVACQAAAAAEQAKNATLALEWYTRGWRFRPSHPGCNRGMANAYLAQENYQNAVEAFDHAFEGGPNDALVYLGRAEARFKGRINETPDDGKFVFYSESVYRDCCAAIKLDPKLAQAYFLRGRACLLDSEKAIHAPEDFSEVIRIDPDHMDAFRSRANCRIGRTPDQRIADCATILQKHPDEVSTLLMRGRLLLQTNRPAAALPDLNKAVSLKPGALTPLLLRGDAFSAIGEREKAAQDFAEVLRLNPKVIDSIRNFVMYKPHTECDPTEKSHYYSLCLHLNPNNPDIYSWRAQSHEKGNRTDAALLDYSKVVEMKPSDPWAYRERASCYRRAKRYPEAIRDLTKVIELEPSNDSHYRERGWLKLEAGERVASIADFTESIRLSKNSAVAYSGRAEAYTRLKEYAKALDDYDEAIQKEPQNEKHIIDKAMVKSRMGEHSQAIREFDAAIDGQRGSINHLKLAKAWILSTCPDASVRNGKLARETVKDGVASGSLQLNGQPRLDGNAVAASAFAEIGEFDKAVLLQSAVVKFASEDARAIEQRRLASYRERKPWRE